MQPKRTSKYCSRFTQITHAPNFDVISFLNPQNDDANCFFCFGNCLIGTRFESNLNLMFSWRFADSFMLTFYAWRGSLTHWMRSIGISIYFIRWFFPFSKQFRARDRKKNTKNGFFDYFLKLQHRKHMNWFKFRLCLDLIMFEAWSGHNLFCWTQNRWSI